MLPPNKTHIAAIRRQANKQRRKTLLKKKIIFHSSFHFATAGKVEVSINGTKAHYEHSISRIVFPCTLWCTYTLYLYIVIKYIVSGKSFKSRYFKRPKVMMTKIIKYEYCAMFRPYISCILEVIRFFTQNKLIKNIILIITSCLT